MTKLYMVDEGNLHALRSVMKRLFTEKRMNGDEMRDAAQIIEAALQVAILVPEPEQPNADRAGIGVEEQELVSNAICQRRFQWCRARLLHALAGAAEQGVLEEVLDELLPDFYGEFCTKVLSTFKESGWIDRVLPDMPSDEERYKVALDCLGRWMRSQKIIDAERSLLMSAGYLKYSVLDGWQLTELGEKVAVDQGLVPR